jgi:hypothetical protein
LSIDDYYQWLHDAGFEPTGDGTLLTEEWSNAAGTFIMITRPQELSPRERFAAIERYKKYLGIGYPMDRVSTSCVLPRLPGTAVADLGPLWSACSAAWQAPRRLSSPIDHTCSVMPSATAGVVRKASCLYVAFYNLCRIRSRKAVTASINFFSGSQRKRAIQNCVSTLDQS